MEISPPATTQETDTRLALARDWLQGLYPGLRANFESVAGDASFRRYFRLRVDGRSRILMDAPPPGENVDPFIDVCRRLRSARLHAPEIIHADRLRGFLLLEDLGDTLYRSLLTEANADEHFPALFETLRVMAQDVAAAGLPAYDAGLLRAEMDLFPDWYLGRHRQGLDRGRFEPVWEAFCETVIRSALQQPRCFVHRDFHSCNLLETGRGGIGIVDFQDAVRGPLSYDFISLIWDRYIHWPRARIEAWMEEYRHLLGLATGPDQWRRDCDLMGLQRNIKVVGIFARLRYRDDKDGYIEMIPQFYDYVVGTLRRYPEFSPMLDFMESPECAP